MPKDAQRPVANFGRTVLRTLWLPCRLPASRMAEPRVASSSSEFAPKQQQVSPHKLNHGGAGSSIPVGTQTTYVLTVASQMQGHLSAICQCQCFFNATLCLVITTITAFLNSVPLHYVVEG